MPTNCREYIDKRYTVITASKRHSRYLSVGYADDMLADGRMVWETPTILPWRAWLATCWEEHQLTQQTEQLLLKPHQARMIWQQVIEGSVYAREFLQSRPVVEQAMRAFELCSTHGIAIFPDTVYLNRDALAFRDWTRQYQARLAECGWVDPVMLPAVLMDTQFNPGSEGLVFYGFDEFTPQQQQLMGYLQERGCDIVIDEPVPRNEQVRYLGLADSNDEIRRAALWAKSIIKTSPQSHVGIVVPQLQEQRDTVIGILDEVFHPERLLQQQPHPEKYYAIAPGRPLTDYPVIHAALQILALGQRRQPLQRLGLLLRSSFVRGGIDHRDARSRFYAQLCRSGEPAWSLTSLINYAAARTDRMGDGGGFIAMLEALLQLQDSLKRRQGAADWAETFTHWLKLFGWPGDRELDSAEYQTLGAWKDALMELSSLEGVSGQCDYTEALGWLNNLLYQSSFQPETTETPVQVSGLPGVAGMQFDHLWVTGLDDQAWPEVARPNPFIPFVLQREYALSGASADNTLKRCRALTASLLNSACDLTLSYPLADGDRICRPSPLLLHYLQADSVEPLPWQSWKASLLQSVALESLQDEQAPALIATDESAGGTAILADQAACPFRAFARHRLHAESIAVTDIGLDAAARGSLAHNVLQGLWQRLRSQAALNALDPAQCQALVKDVVMDALRQQAGRQPESLSSTFRELEAERLQQLTQDWLAHERSRPAFKIHEIEEWHRIRFAGLELLMRIDRVDELDDGSLFIIDYKTGQTNLKQWDGERPDAPQLPLYALNHEGDVRALAFGGLKKGKLGFAGLSDRSGRVPGLDAVMDDGTGDDAWQARLAQWREVLTQLAGEFITGHAAVDPKEASSCRYCDLHTLCRIHEIVANAGMDMEAEGESGP